MPSSQQVYLAAGPTDLRKGIDGLAVIVQEHFKLDPFSHCLFVFCNRSRDKLKVLEWSGTGFWLHYLRLEKSRFQWPSSSREAVPIDQRQFRWLLDGLSLDEKQAHSNVKQRTII